MIETAAELNVRPLPDAEMAAIAEYVAEYEIASEEAWATARLNLMDSMGCALLALRFPECTKLLGPVVPGTTVPFGARVPGTHYELDPIKAAFDIGTLIRWVDFNDAWLAAEWNHPSDNLGGILAVADYVSRNRMASGEDTVLTMKNVLRAMIKAHEIQGIIALENSFNRVGLDHVVLVKAATATVVAALLGGGKREIVDALSQVWVDGQSLRTYRHAPNTGSRKSWAAGDATSRGVSLALLTLKGEEGYPSALTARTWGFYDATFRGRHFTFSRPYGSYVMENVLFKPAFPAEYHAQTAVECALILHPNVASRLSEISRVVITTQESAVRIISKVGPLYNPADRDHCIQYMVAVGLIFGELTADHYHDPLASDPRIDALREKMEVIEDPRYSRDYLDPEKRTVSNAVQIFFKDGTSTANVEIEVPLGHRLRRAEAVPLLFRKFRIHAGHALGQEAADRLITLFQDRDRLETLPVCSFMDLFVPR